MSSHVTQLPPNAPGSPPPGPFTAVPLTKVQERTWFVDQLAPGSYHVLLALRIEGSLDVGALHSAMGELITRHEVLRTGVVSVDGVAVGVLRNAEAFAIEVEDHTGTTVGPGLDELLVAEATRPLDLEHGLPVRVRLLRLSTDDHVLVITVHHLAFDNWSRDVLYRELTVLYDAFAAGQTPPLRRLPCHYREAMARQEQVWSPTELDEGLGRRRRELTGLTAFELPPDRPRPARRRGAGKTLEFTVSRTVADGLVELGRSHGATGAVVQLAAGLTALYRYTGRTDVTVGTPCALRDLPESQELIGVFVNMLVLANDLSGNPTFAELVGRVRDATLNAFEDRHVPFDRLVEELAPERDASRTPLFQVQVNFAAEQRRVPRLNGLTVTELAVPHTVSKYDLTIGFERAGDRLCCELTWDPALYSTDTMEGLAGVLRAVLGRVTENPSVRIDDIDLLEADERERIHRLATGPRVEPPDRCLHELFEAQAARTPDAVAVVDDRTSLTYRELNARASAMARILRAHGVGPDVPVGVMLDRSVDLVVALLGVLKAGGAYLPLETETPEARTIQLLDGAGAPVCLAHADRTGTVTSSQRIGLTVAQATAHHTGAPDEPTGVRPDHLCAIYYTSGSTGRPKGVASTHVGWANRMEWMQRRFRLHPGDTVLQKTTLTFDDAAEEIFWPLAVGGRIAMLGAGLHRDPHAIIEAAVRYDAVHLQFVPSVLDLFLDALTDDAVKRLDRLRSVLSAGEALRPQVIQRFLDIFGDRVTLDNNWGTTEVSIDTVHHVCGPADALPTVDPVRLGRPTDNTEVYVLSGRLDLLPAGVPGELCIGGVGLARGYLGSPALTAASFVPHPFRTGERLYRTGDRGRLLADGSLAYLDRRDRQVKVRGVRIELGEVEAGLRAHPGVADAVTVVWEAVPGDKRLAAYAAPRHDQSLTVAELRTHLVELLPSYAVPSSITILPALPRGPNGKLDRRGLPPPDPESTRETEYVAPRTSTETVLADIWVQVLGVPRLGVHDNFFAAGGHSLLVIRAINRMRAAFGVSLPMSLLFERPTLAEAAERVEMTVLADIEAMTEEEVAHLL